MRINKLNIWDRDYEDFDSMKKEQDGYDENDIVDYLIMEEGTIQEKFDYEKVIGADNFTSLIDFLLSYQNEDIDLGLVKVNVNLTDPKEEQVTNKLIELMIKSKKKDLVDLTKLVKE